MQVFKSRFTEKDGQHQSSIHSCIRTDDIDLVGDGNHLTSFEMIGNFSFGNDDYLSTCRMWDAILCDLEFPVTHVTVHPSQTSHEAIWRELGYKIVLDEGCLWSDGNIGGYCCEIFSGELEVGNLVNPMGDSVDVGFGMERMVQILENKERVDETSLFGEGHPIVRDHERTLRLMQKNGVYPGAKSRLGMCRQLVRRVLKFVDALGELTPWLESENELLLRRRLDMERYSKRFGSKPPEYWKETHGWTVGEITELLGYNPFL